MGSGSGSESDEATFAEDVGHLQGRQVVEQLPLSMMLGQGREQV